MKNLITAYPNVLFGVDAELFFIDPKNGEVIPGKKLGLPMYNETPYQSPAGGIIHADGIVGEFTTIPKYCRAYTLDQIFFGLKSLRQIAEKNNVELKVSSAEPIPKKLFKECDKIELEFGCAPENIAWLDGAEFQSNPEPEHEMRYAGAHIHLGAKEMSDKWTTSAAVYPSKIKKILTEKAIDIVKVLDICLGLPMMIIDRSDTAKQRREYYGKPGAFRYKPYGLEYRVLSNETFLSAPWIASLSLVICRSIVDMFCNDMGDEFLKQFSQYNIPNIFFEDDIEEAIRISARGLAYLSVFCNSMILTADDYHTMLRLLVTMANDGGVRAGFKYSNDKRLRTFNIYNTWDLRCKSTSHHGGDYIGGMEMIQNVIQVNDLIVPFENEDLGKTMREYRSEFQKLIN